ncbi:flavodoxin and radical SAM domain- containing protein [Coccidioides immitis RMSCC 3703]|uniref:tRNA 4-demethylwyosine synthase (AdoMet-dependent) n=1 Tax=Coccidioides immitis RMSCC 3703 TaxID=454286 RepID=A0A0J8QTB2_COCIT|nr:flavodoxin and radical SAM domain- containing protein [Coccidioides immitis RMSCC 3703]
MPDETFASGAQRALSLWHSYRGFSTVDTFTSPVLESQTKPSNLGDRATYLHHHSGGGNPFAECAATRSKGRPPKRVIGTKPAKKGTKLVNGDSDATKEISIQPIIFFSSLTGSTERSAKRVLERLNTEPLKDSKRSSRLLAPQLYDLSYVDFDDYFVSPPKAPESNPNVLYFYCIIIPTYNIDTILNTFLGHLDETHHDFRIDTAPLSGLAGYAVFGFGDKEGWPTEEEGFCSQAKEVDKWMAKLTGRKRAYPLGLGDVKTDGDKALDEWCSGMQEVLSDMVTNNGALGEGVPGSGDPLESDEEDVEEDDEGVPNPGSRPRKARRAEITDLEDIKFGGDASGKQGSDIPIDFTTYSKTSTSVATSTPKEMVPTTSPTYAALTKQGYTIVGSHSGVKICRWTKSALRGRGSCYKNSFYGIKSHLCMETTPSLSCSNKCVFCWRHGTNPVGTTWRWKVDPPELIFQGVKEGHYKKIKMMRGVPGVRAERFAEAMRIRHCALSLVGEPIFYPHINEFVSMLHSEHISSFLVCNAQHPDQLAALDRITQLYVSIDASNRDSLRKIDQISGSASSAAWDIIREKTHVQRTVYRLTLVKGFNIDDEVVGYADLVERGLPCFVEIKGVTYCGTSTSAGAGLTMQNVPFYEEVAAFAVALNDELNRRGLGYGIGAEHSHSCCILLASRRFHVDGKWHTKINYERFFELLEREKAEGVSFTPEDYMSETDEWALWGNGGFDPNDQRVYRKGKNKANMSDAGSVPKGGVVEI